MALFIRLPIVALLAMCGTTVLAQDLGTVQWHTDLDAARTMAEKQNKLLLVHFYTDSCGPCKMLDATVFNQPTVAQALKASYVPVKLNASEFQATAERFGITRVPTDVVITPEGRVLERMVSPATPMAYIGRMAGVAEQYRQQAGRNFQTAAASQGTSQPLNSAYAALSVPQADANSFTDPNQQGQQQVMANQFATGTAAPSYGASTGVSPAPAAEPPASPPVAIANPYAQPSATAQVEASTPAAPASDDRYTNATDTAVTPQPAVTPVAEAPATSEQVASAPQLPAGSPPLGFFGYCPVTMKKENRWQQGDVRWGCYHRGRTYLFASAEKRDEFLSTNGDDFAPALSGIDPVLAIDEGKAEPGKQEFGIEYEGQFYLFSSEDNLRKFWSQADHYATGVRQAMNATPQAPKYR